MVRSPDAAGLRWPSRSWRRATVLLAAMAGVLVGCSNSGSVSPDRTAASVATQPPAEPAASQSGSWRRIAPAPVPPAGGMATAWTGSLLVAWGGQTPGGTWQAAAVGAAYDPAAGRWQVLPAAPVAGRFGATAVWTGREVLFWGGQAGFDTTFADGAAYDPAARRWRSLPAAPIGPRTGHEAVWTGGEMVVWGGYPRCCPTDSVIHDQAAAAYNPATDTWRRIAPVPPPWSGDDGTAVTMVETNSAAGTDGQAVDHPLIWRRGRLIAYDAGTEAWNVTAGVPPEPQPGDQSLPSTTGDPFALGTVLDREVFTWAGKAGDLQGLAWRSSDATWRRTATLGAQAGGRLTAGGPGRIYAAAGQSTRILEYRIADDRWEELPLPPITTRSAATLVWTGSELLFWGGVGDESPEMDGAIWHCC